MTNRQISSATLPADLLSALISNSPHPTIITDSEHRIRLINKAAKRAYPSEDALAKLLEQQRSKSSALHGTASIEWQTMRYNVDTDDELIVYYGSDTSELQAVKTDNHLLRNIIKKVPGYVFWKDPDSVLQGCNENFSRQVGLDDPDEIIGKTDYDLPWDKAQSDAFIADDRLIMQARKPRLDFVESQRQADGSIATLLTSKVPMIDSDGQLCGLLGSYVDISALKQVESSLRQEKERAEAAAHAKDEFLANMSHDVKTPLSGIIGMTELLGHCKLDDDSRNHANHIHTSATALLKFFDNCLLLAQPSSSTPETDAVPFALDALINDIVALIKPSLAAKGLSLTLDHASNTPNHLIGSPASLYRILLNLISNAIKFTAQGSITVRISHTQTDDTGSIKLILAVEDTGIGISETEQGKIFDKFTRLTPAHQGLYSGSGIGLYIAKQFTLAMGGELKVNSREGHGSTFTARIPVKLDTAQAEVSSQQQSEADNHDKPRALAVEDCPLQQKILRSFFTMLDCELDVADCGQAALSLFKQKKYDLVLMDIGLHDIPGHEVAKRMLAIEQTHNPASKTPIIAITAHLTEATKARCEQNGLADALSKPLSLDTLAELIKHYAASSV